MTGSGSGAMPATAAALGVLSGVAAMRFAARIAIRIARSASAAWSGRARSIA